MVAGVLALGAVHLEVAAGNDLLGPVLRGDAGAPVTARTVGKVIATNVDRSAKGDRDAAVKPNGGVTMSFEVPSLPDTSVLMRVSAGGAADAIRKAPASSSGAGKGSAAGVRPIACEPPVSVLSAVARQLEPGRCVT